MKVFVWDYVNKMSNNYHSGGGVVIIAKTLTQARKLFREGDYIGKYHDEGDTTVFNTAPTLILKCQDTEERVFVFPDAGCCG